MLKGNQCLLMYKKVKHIIGALVAVRQNSLSAMVIVISLISSHFIIISSILGSHKGTDFTPIAYTATETKKAYFCGCKQSSNKPLCDGSHKKLPEDAQGKGFSVDYCAKLV